VKESAVPVPVSALRAAEWDLAYRAHGEALLRYLRRFARTQEIAEELLQETFARAIRTQGPLPSSDAIRPWLYRVATNIAIDHIRRTRRFAFVPFLGGERAPERDADQIDLVRRVLQEMPADQSTALVLRLHEGFAPIEIAELLGITEAAVRSRLVRGRRKFQETYERMGGEL
jgi:RNA polymerase sigma-70 factor (ECF subfamily)